MKRPNFSSQAIAKEIERVYGKKAEVVHVNMRDEAEVGKYVMNIEEAHRKARKSKLVFR